MRSSNHGQQPQHLRSVARHDAVLADASFQSIEAIKSAVTLRVVVERLERGDINGAIDAIQVEREAFSALELALAEAYNAGGISLVENLPRLKDPEGNRVSFRSGVTPPGGRGVAARPLIATCNPYHR
nr:hypothetical protein [Phyllobacterium sp. A18/5-2]